MQVPPVRRSGLQKCLTIQLTFSDHQSTRGPRRAISEPRPIRRRQSPSPLHLDIRRAFDEMRRKRRAARAHVARRLPPARSSSSGLASARGRRRCASARRTSPHLPAPRSFSDPDATLRLHYSASRPAVHVTPRLLPFASRLLPAAPCPLPHLLRNLAAHLLVALSFSRLRFLYPAGGAGRVGRSLLSDQEKGRKKKTALSFCGRRFARRSLAEAAAPAPSCCVATGQAGHGIRAPFGDSGSLRGEQLC